MAVTAGTSPQANGRMTRSGKRAAPGKEKGRRQTRRRPPNCKSRSLAVRPDAGATAAAARALGAATAAGALAATAGALTAAAAVATRTLEGRGLGRVGNGVGA